MPQGPDDFYVPEHVHVPDDAGYRRELAHAGERTARRERWKLLAWLLAAASIALAGLALLLLV